MTIYLIGVVLMAIAIGYFNYQMLPKLYKIWQFWLSATLLCLLSWVGIVIVIVLAVKHAISKDQYEEED